MIYETIQKELIFINQKINDIQKQLSMLPQGKINVKQNQKRFKWYVSHENTMKYLPKSERNLAEDLARRKYLSYRLEELIKEKEAIINYLKQFSGFSYKSEKLLNNPLYIPLLKVSFKTKSEIINEWSTASYTRKNNYSENLKHKTLSKNLVRSKSEAMIDSALFQNEIPYRYECLLQLDDDSFYPDFTILHPKTEEIYYWEHFGMMENPEYATNTFSKLLIYSSNNIIPTINLITTYETKDNPLSMYQIEKIICEYFK